LAALTLAALTLAALTLAALTLAALTLAALTLAALTLAALTLAALTLLADTGLLKATGLAGVVAMMAFLVAVRLLISDFFSMLMISPWQISVSIF
jgi:hypothetical protein